MFRRKLAAFSVAVSVAALIFAAVAVAGSPSVGWTARDMKTAVRGLGYPKPHPKKLACKGLGVKTGGRYGAFRCVATYRHHRRRVFYTAGRGLGGWICAGAKLATCKILRRGFVTTAQVTADGSLSFAAQLATRGYVQNRYDTFDTYPAGGCTQTATRTWTCPYKLDAGTITVTVTLKKAVGGYVTRAGATVS